MRKLIVNPIQPAEAILSRFRSALSGAERLLSDLRPCEYPDAMAAVERLRVIIDCVRIEAVARPTASSPPKAGRLLSVKEAAERLGRSPTWIYRHINDLPYVSLPGGGIGFRSETLDGWVAEHEA